MNKISSFQKAIIERKALKVISGINNFNVKKVSNLIYAASMTKATYIDVGANAKLVQTVRKITHLPICISSIDTSIIYKCIVRGVSVVEIGNYDNFYKDKQIFSIHRILAIVSEVRSLFPKITLCVTIPHNLLIQEQIFLMKKLTELQVDALQTEGIISYAEKQNKDYMVSEALDKVSATLSTTYALSQIVSIPIITASGITQTTASVAMQYGASGVGIGNSIVQLESRSSMIRMINTIHKLLSNHSTNIIEYSLGNLSFSLNFISNQNKRVVSC
uniref:hypothetical protein n=1 Tax=Rhodospora sordida TaxID=362230 RepID=UPI001FCD28F8|nr:hypothetical protein MW557_pgp141 [Rhodospora sordida]UNJ14953.1 hypothetical protein [Rhodospora sordida]